VNEYLRREIQDVAKWIRTTVEALPTRLDPKPGEFDTLEYNLIRYIRGVACNEHENFGMSRHVIDGYTLSLIFRRYGKRLRQVRYVGVQQGETFGRTADGPPWATESRLKHA
jgi:hypothetical protein